MGDEKITKAILDGVRHIEGFPIGEDEDLIALSNPPYYTSFPNPFIEAFIKENGTTYVEDTDDYHREPFVSDISQGKSDSFYRAHTYHTKVPYKAIVPFIEHYTEPNNIVYDGFCGSGMTGVAALLSGRNAILSDLSPAASFISSSFVCFNNVDLNKIMLLVSRIIEAVKKETAWMYLTEINSNKQQINFAIWSDIFICSYCNTDFKYSDAVADFKGKSFSKEIHCPSCSANLDQKKLERVWEDNTPKRVPVLLNVSNIDSKRSYFRDICENDLNILNRIEKYQSPYFYPTKKYYGKGEKFGDMYVKSHHKGLSTVNKYFLTRSLHVLSCIFDQIEKQEHEYNQPLKFIFTSILQRCSLLNRLRPSLSGDPMTGTLYIASLIREENPLRLFESKAKAILKAYKEGIQNSQPKNKVAVQVSSATDLRTVPDNSIDYIYTDPPFGRNLMYSELNYLWESWLSCFTNNKSEAIKNNSQNKGVGEYRNLMLASFEEYYRILKPNRWITVVFHNSEAVIWNSIQESLSKAGFIIAQVVTMDKKQGSYKQIIEAGSVKHDLVINAYKPLTEFKKKFLKFAGVNSEYAFVKQHLQHLPKDKNIERTEHMLYSKMLATYIQHGFEINMNAKDFYYMLSENFFERDRYWFNEDEVREYELMKKIGKLKHFELSGGALFILDERSAIAWINHYLQEPKTYNDISTDFFKNLSISEDQIPELKLILEDNFVSERGMYRRAEILERHQIEDRRENNLLKEFEKILEEAKVLKKLKDVRKEAVLVGFSKCYREKRFEDIILVGHKIPRRVIENSIEIFDFIDIAESKLGVY